IHTLHRIPRDYTVKTKKHFTARYCRAHLYLALLENLPKGIVQFNKKTINVHADLDQGMALFFEDGSSARVDICEFSTVRPFAEACPSFRLFPNYARGPLKIWSFKNRVPLVSDTAHTHGDAFVARGSLAFNDANALGLSPNHLRQASSCKGERPTAKQITKICQVYENTRNPHIDKILGVVNKAMARQRASFEKGKVEADEELRQRVAIRMALGGSVHTISERHFRKLSMVERGLRQTSHVHGFGVDGVPVSGH
ncbi:unnamed protein product, partial [Clonostachys rosea]